MVDKTHILGTEYKIEFKSQEELQKIVNTNSFLYGCTDFENKIIYLYSNLVGLQEEETLLHEVTHCYFRESGLDTQCDYARNEELVDWIAIQFPKMVETYKECEISFLTNKNKKKKKVKDDTTENNGCPANSIIEDGVGIANKHRTPCKR